jgi:hypothetical protein
MEQHLNRSTPALMEALRQSSPLKTFAQRAVFEASLQALGQRRLSRPEIMSLYAVFDDATEDHGMMFGLVHLIDACTAQDHGLGAQCLLDAFDGMGPLAQEWSEILVARTVNHEAGRSELARRLQKGVHSRMLSQIRHLAQDSNPRLARHAAWVLDAVQPWPGPASPRPAQQA